MQKMINEKEVSVMERPEITHINLTGYPREMLGLENVVSQPECAGIDFYGSEILEGDEIAIDKDNFEEIILKEHVKRYLIEKCHFLYKGGIYVDMDREEIVKEHELEQYLHEVHGFEFMIAK
jgi:hypothetical protein